MSGNLAGALLMLLGMAAFALNDTIGKWLVADYGVAQVILLRSLAAGLMMAPFFLRGKGVVARVKSAPRPGLQALRAICATAEVFCFYLAVFYMPLVDVMAFWMAAPIYVVAVSPLLLGERVSAKTWTAVAVGFAGVLLIVKPGTAAFEFSSVLAIIAVVTLAVRDLVTRRLPPEVGSGLLSAGAFGSMGVAGLVLLAVGAQQPIAPSAGQGALMAATLCFGLLGYITMVIATRIAEIAVIAPFRYSRLLFAMLLAVAVFGERPDAATLLGAALIAGAGIYSMWREARLRRAQLAAL